MSDPSPSELQRQHENLVQEMRAGFASIDARLALVPTSELLTVHLGAWEKQLAAVAATQRDADERHADRLREAERRFQEDLREVKVASEAGDARLQTKLEEQAVEARASKRWAVMAGIGTAGVLISFIALIAGFGGA